MRQCEKYFLSVFKMAEIFENLNNILCDWAKAKVELSFVEAVNRFEN